MYENLKEAIEIVRNADRKRRYVMMNENTRELLCGTACDIYGEIIMNELLDLDIFYIPADNLDIEAWALIEVSYNVTNLQSPITDQQREIIALMNEIVEGEEE